MRNTTGAVVVTALLALTACASTDGGPATTPTARSSVRPAPSSPAPSTATPVPPTPTVPTTTVPTTTPTSPRLRPGPTRPSSPQPSPTAPAPVVRAGRAAWVSVAVSTLWRSPSSPRPVDAGALRSPVDIRGWLGAMTLDQRRQLVGRADTQALLGDRVLVLTVRGAWAEVVVPDQPTPLDRRGYPGWVPVRQLTAIAPSAGPGQRAATVVARTAWLRSDDGSATPLTEVSYGTRLPVLTSMERWVRVRLPGGTTRRLALSAVVLHQEGSAALSPTGIAVVRDAQSFAGLPYLWAGRSGFGFDCSGLTSLVFRVHGVMIPRDADAQAAGGVAVSDARRGAGDLLFYAAPGGPVHHVSLYAGGGLMVQSPATGRVVETISVASVGFAAQYVGARRYLR